MWEIEIEFIIYVGLLWWIIDKPKQAGYRNWTGGQFIDVLPKSRAEIVYLSDVQPDSLDCGDVVTSTR